MPEQHKLLLSSILLLLAAIIFAGAVVYLVHGNGQVYTVGTSTSAPIPHQPDESLPHYSQLNPVGGVVKAVGASSIDIVQGPGNTNPATVLVDKNTTIYKTGALKDPQVFDAEIKAFSAETLGAPSSYTYVMPDRFIEIPLTLKDIQVGDTVFINTTNSLPATSIHAVLLQVTSTSSISK
jgi:hypothetical protein